MTSPGQSYEQIAIYTGIAEGTVKSSHFARSRGRAVARRSSGCWWIVEIDGGKPLEDRIQHVHLVRQARAFDHPNTD